MARINSRNKGAQGEREWAQYLSNKGYKAERGQQHSGSPDSPDVICKGLPIHWEVKRVEKLNLEAAVAQAVRDTGKNVPAVAHRKNRKRWMITLHADDFFKLLKKGL